MLVDQKIVGGNWNRGGMMKQLLLQLAVIGSLFVAKINAQDAGFDLTRLDRVVESELERVRCPGASIAVVKADRVVYAKGYGIANVDSQAPVTSDMLFRIGSTTKMITAVGLLMLAEEGKIDLQSPIEKAIEGLSPPVGRLTAHQLLTHTSGLSDIAVMNGPHDESALKARVQSLSQQDFFDEPNTIYSYSNPGYWVAGLLIQESSGKAYADFLAERIFRPLGMKQSTFRPTAAMTWPLAVGHGPEDRSPPKVIRPLADNAATWPAGQLFCTASEFARFCIAVMNDGAIDGKQVLSKSVIEQLSHPHVSIPNEDRHYAYGLSVRDAKQLRWISHSGSRTGYGSHVRMCPEKKFAVVILCNKTGVELQPVADRAAEMILGTEVNAVNESASREKPMPLDVLPEEASRYVGRYTNGAVTHLLKAEQGRLYFTRNRPVKKLGERSFIAQATVEAPAVSFSLVFNDRNEITHLMTKGRAFRKE